MNPPPRPFSSMSLVDRIEIAGFPGWFIVALALLLAALFVAQLVGRRTAGSLLAYLALAILPLVVGIWGAGRNALVSYEHLGPSGVGDPAAFNTALAELIYSLVLGAQVSVLGLVATVVLGLLGTSPVRPPEPQSGG